MANNVDTVLFTLPTVLFTLPFFHTLYILNFWTFKGLTFGFQTVDFLPSLVHFCAFKKNLCTFKLQLSPFIPVTISLHWSGYLLLFLPESTFIPSAFYSYSLDFLPLFGRCDQTMRPNDRLTATTEGNLQPFKSSFESVQVMGVYVSEPVVID